MPRCHISPDNGREPRAALPGQLDLDGQGPVAGRLHGQIREVEPAPSPLGTSPNRVARLFWSTPVYRAQLALGEDGSLAELALETDRELGRAPIVFVGPDDDPTPVPNTNLCLFTPTVGERGRIVRGGLRGLLEPSCGRQATRASGGASGVPRYPGAGVESNRRHFGTGPGL